METTKGWKASRERMESVSGVRCAMVQGGSCGVRTQGTTIIREREEPMVRWCGGAGAWHITARQRMDMALRHRGAHGDNREAQCGPAVRKKPRFTHVRGYFRGDVRGKRFSTHAMERNVARIGDGGCGNDKGMSSAWGE